MKRSELLACLLSVLVLMGTITLTTFQAFGEIAAPSASGAGECREYADLTSHTMKLSCNTGVFSDILTALTGLTSVPLNWAAFLFVGPNAAAPPVNTTMAVFKTGPSGATVSIIQPVVALVGINGTSNATIDLTDASETAVCTVQFPCNGLTTGGKLVCNGAGGATCACNGGNATLAANTFYEYRSKTLCTGATALAQLNVTAIGTVP